LCGVPGCSFRNSAVPDAIRARLSDGMDARSSLRRIGLAAWGPSISGLPRARILQMSGPRQSIPARLSTVPQMMDRLLCPGTVQHSTSSRPVQVASAAETSGLRYDRDSNRPPLTRPFGNPFKPRTLFYRTSGHHSSFSSATFSVSGRRYRNSAAFPPFGLALPLLTILIMRSRSKAKVMSCARCWLKPL